MLKVTIFKQPNNDTHFSCEIKNLTGKEVISTNAS